MFTFILSHTASASSALKSVIFVPAQKGKPSAGSTVSLGAQSSVLACRRSHRPYPRATTAMRAVLPRIPTSHVQPQCRLESRRRSPIPSQSNFVVGGNLGKPSAAGYAYFPRRAEAGKGVITDRHVSIERWEDELVNSSMVGVRRPEGANTIATWSQPISSSINGPPSA